MRGRDHSTGDGGQFFYVGDLRQAEAEYAKFRGCIAQLLDDQTMVGDVLDRWVVFKDGWVYGMATYPHKTDAVAFANQMFRGEPDASYIIVQADLKKHGLNIMEILASGVPDSAGFDISTTPDECNRRAED